GPKRGHWIEHYPGAATQIPHSGKSAMQMHDSLNVDRDHRGSRFGEVVDVQIGIGDHQMTIERQVCCLAGGFDHQGPNRDVWDEVAVHNIDVNQSGSPTLGGFDFVAELSE